MIDVYHEIEKMRQAGRPFVVATIIRTEGSTPAGVGAKMLVTEDGTARGTIGGGCIDEQVKTHAVRVLHTERPTTVTVTLNDDATTASRQDGLICGGSAEVFLEPVVVPRLFIFGAGHIGLTTSKIAKLVGFGVTIVDDRADYANRERFPHVDDVVVGRFDGLDAIAPPEGAYIVIVTRGHKHDETVLAWAIKRRATYLGMIGSREKVRKTMENLAAKGVPRDVLSKVHAPIGVDIKAQTTDEIAVSIVAQLIQHRRRGET